MCTHVAVCHLCVICATCSSFLSLVVLWVFVEQKNADILYLCEQFQSDFHLHHSTQTALLKVTSSLLMATDSGLLSMLILLDLSAALGTISYSIFLHRLASISLSETTPGLVLVMSLRPHSVHSIVNINIPAISPLLQCYPGLCSRSYSLHHFSPPPWPYIPQIPHSVPLLCGRHPALPFH